MQGFECSKHSKLPHIFLAMTMWKVFDNTMNPVKVSHHLMFWVYSLMVTYLINFTLASGNCIKMRPVENVKGNISECIWTRFSSPVPTYFCTEVCDR